MFVVFVESVGWNKLFIDYWALSTKIKVWETLQWFFIAVMNKLEEKKNEDQYFKVINWIYNYLWSTHSKSNIIWMQV